MGKQRIPRNAFPKRKERPNLCCCGSGLQREYYDIGPMKDQGGCEKCIEPLRRAWQQMQAEIAASSSKHYREAAAWERQEKQKMEDAVNRGYAALMEEERRNRSKE